MGSIQPSNIPEVDALLVGAGFGSYTMLNRLRKLGLSCKLYEKGSRSGGVWYWNCYVSFTASKMPSMPTILAWCPRGLGYPYLPAF
jgi:cation diffusion facilitator CzcD-associated flavoprotein CzcO